jgi:hypothetical protein
MIRRLGVKAGDRANADGLSRPTYAITTCENLGPRRIARDTGDTLSGRRVYEVADCFVNDGNGSECYNGLDSSTHKIPERLYLLFKYISGGCTHYDEMLVPMFYNPVSPENCDGFVGWKGGIIYGGNFAIATLECVNSRGLGCEWRLSATPMPIFGVEVFDDVFWPAGPLSTPFELSQQITVHGGCDTAVSGPAGLDPTYYSPSVYQITIAPASVINDPEDPSGLLGLAKRYGTRESRSVYAQACCTQTPTVTGNCCLYDDPGPTVATFSISPVHPYFGILNGLTIPLVDTGNRFYQGSASRTICGVIVLFTIQFGCFSVFGAGGELNLAASFEDTHSAGLSLQFTPVATYGPRCLTPYQRWEVGIAAAAGLCDPAPQTGTVVVIIT